MKPSLLPATVGSLLLGFASLPLHAAGMATHALMAEYGRTYLADSHPLKAILTAHRPALLAGAIYPDGGYFTGIVDPAGRDIAEHAHWEYFHNPLMEQLRAEGCTQGNGLEIPVFNGTLDYYDRVLEEVLPLAEVRIDDSCGTKIAFAMGMAAHGLGDQVWDSLFEPQLQERGEDLESSPAYTADAFPPGADSSVGDALRAVVGDEPFDLLASGFGSASLNSMEYSMDVIAIREQDIWADVPYLTFPPTQTLLSVYEQIGTEGASAERIEAAALGTRTLVLAERAGAAVEFDRVRQQMPFGAGHYFTGSGGVIDTGHMIAALYEQLWDKLQQGVAESRPPRLAGLHPENGERDVPVGRSADRYLRAYLSSAVHWAAVPETERAGVLVLFDEAGNVVPTDTMDMQARLYQGGGSHGLGVRIRETLLPDHEYTAVLTTRARDERGKALGEPFVWSFRTAAEN